MNAKGILVNCIICACVIAASAHYVLKVERTAVEQINARQNAWEAEKEALLAAKSSSQPLPTDVQLSLDTDSTLLINRLSNLNSDPKKKLREAFFCFQGLVEEGEKAIPAIRDYFTTGENVVLIENTGGFRGRGPGNRNGRGRNNNFNNNNTGTANTDLPSTTRIGLIDVLNDIGGKDAINLLGQILPTTLNAQELSYLSTILQSIDSNIFVNTTITTARNLLANTSITEGDKRQLLQLLASLGDTEYAAAMLGSLVTNNGIDGSVLDFAIQTLGEAAIPAIYDAFMNQNLNPMDQARLMTSAMDYVGRNSQATEMFNTAYNEVADNPMLSRMMILGLGGIGPNNNVSVESAAGRLNVLESIEQNYAADDQMSQVLAAARAQLEYASNPSAYDEPPQINMQEIMGGMRGAGRFGMGQSGMPPGPPGF